MDLAYLKKLVRILEHSSVDEIEIEEEGLRIRIGKSSQHNSLKEVVLPPPPALQGQGEAAQVQAPQTEPVKEIKYHEIKSPIVGTFYRAPAPDADPYVEVGQPVQPKTVLCIIEAMKLMNEIESDIAGRIIKILVENGQPVEYNQTLFLIEPL